MLIQHNFPLLTPPSFSLIIHPDRFIMHNPKDRKFVLIFSLLIIIMLLIFRNSTFNRFQPLPSPVSTPTPILHSATVTIGLNTQKITSFTRDTPATASALSLLTDAASRHGLILITKKYSFGTLVESIGGQKNTAAKAWIYFINGKSASVGADQYLIQPGDIIEWKYVKPQF